MISPLDVLIEYSPLGASVYIKSWISLHDEQGWLSAIVNASHRICLAFCVYYTTNSTLECVLSCIVFIYTVILSVCPCVQGQIETWSAYRLLTRRDMWLHSGLMNMPLPSLLSNLEENFSYFMSKMNVFYYSALSVILKVGAGNTRTENARL